MPPQGNTTNSTTKDPAMGSFSVQSKETLPQDLLRMRLESVVAHHNSDNETLADAGIKRTLDIDAAEKALNIRFLNNQKDEETPKELPVKTPPRNIGGEIISSEERKRQEKLNSLLDLVSRQSDELKKLKNERELSANNSKNKPDTLNNQDTPHIEPSPESVAKISNLLPHFDDRKIVLPEITQPLPIITSEIINEMPSQLSKTRSSKLMPKILAPRPRLINGKTQEERIATLLKPKNSQHDGIDAVIEKVAPNIDLHAEQIVEKITEIPQKIEETFERVQVSTYQRMGDDTEKLFQAINNRKNFILKIISNKSSDMFSDTPTPTGKTN